MKISAPHQPTVDAYSDPTAEEREEFRRVVLSMEVGQAVTIEDTAFDRTNLGASILIRARAVDKARDYRCTVTGRFTAELERIK